MPVIEYDRRTSRFWAAFLPGFLWMSGFYFVPLASLLAYAFYQHTYVRDVPAFQFGNFKKIFYDATNLQVVGRTVLLAAGVTIVDALLAFPVAYFLAFHAGRFRQLLAMLILLPLWSSYLVRVAAWRIILNRNGLLNHVLLELGIISHPSSDFIYNIWAVGITLCYVWLPFMILPLTTAFERLPKRLLEASADLGAGGFTTFRRVTFPLVVPGLLAGCLSVFSLTMGDYITPNQLGSGSSVIGDMVFRYSGTADNWPFAAALSVTVLVILCVVFAALSRTRAMENV